MHLKCFILLATQKYLSHITLLNVQNFTSFVNILLFIVLFEEGKICLCLQAHTWDIVHIFQGSQLKHSFTLYDKNLVEKIQWNLQSQRWDKSLYTISEDFSILYKFLNIYFNRDGKKLSINCHIIISFLAPDNDGIVFEHQTSCWGHVCVMIKHYIQFSTINL